MDQLIIILFVLMFPFYNQPTFPYQQAQISQNSYLNLLQQGYQLNPMYNTMVQIPQPFYINCTQYQ